MSEALARLGHQVDLATAEFKWRLRQPRVSMGPNLRRVPLSRVRWLDYDVVKTEYHLGFRTLQRFRGQAHPFIIARLGDVVAERDRPGIYFYGRTRRAMFRTQQDIARGARYVAVLTESARALWLECFPGAGNILLVPGAADRELPPRGPDPYSAPGTRCVFAGNLYSASRRSQPEVHRGIVEKLNALGGRLEPFGARLHVLGAGDGRGLDPRHVTYFGAVPYERSWDYLRWAHVGVAVTAGPFMHNNESTKLYHYVRAGLPVVSESGFPNDSLVTESGLGFLVPNGDLDLMAQRIASAAVADWDRDRAVRFILARHTWDLRAAVYDRVIRGANGAPSPGASR
jgi:glycosyltransferase involved in cell wall biosynthesis